MLTKVLMVAALTAGSSLMIAPAPRHAGEVRVAQASADSAAVAAAVNAFHHSLAQSDSAGALALLAPDVMVLESGDVQTLAEYRSHHLAGDIAFTKAVPSTSGPMQVSIEGSTAWTVRTSITQGDYKGRAINSAGVESMVLTKSAGKWQIRSIHWSSHNRR